VKNINIFCFGFGQVARNFISKISSKNYDITLTTTSRGETSNEIYNGVNYQNYLFNNDEYDANLIAKLKEADHILVSIPPVEGKDIVIKKFSKFLLNARIKWITYLSATSVYGDHKGNWVDENSKTDPTTKRGTARLSAERSWLALKTNTNLPVQIFRLSGIYSNESNLLTRLKLGTVKLINKQNHYFSRIHVEDIANILFESLFKFKSGEIYNLSDDKPTSSKDITLYGAKLLDIKNLKKIEVNEIENETLKDFYKESKKVKNKKMKFFFDYELKYPTYVEGLNHIRNNFI
jgi:nucleoside-diphosphate-sugar epimerase